MQHKPIPLVLILLAAATAMGQASADIRQGKLAARDLAARYDSKPESSEKPAKWPVPVCARIASAKPEEVALAWGLIGLGLCPADTQPAGEAAPAGPDTSGSTTIRGQGACSVVGKAGQSC